MISEFEITLNLKKLETNTLIQRNQKSYFNMLFMFVSYENQNFANQWWSYNIFAVLTIRSVLFVHWFKIVRIRLH